MEKIFKKSLALMVSAALCLTAFVGCLSVNANGTATVEVGTVENVSVDATEVTVPVTVKGSDIAAAIFEIKVDNAKLSFDGILCKEALTFGEDIYVSTISDGDYIKPVTGTTDTYRFLVEAGTGENVATVTDPTFNLKFKVVSLTAGETVAITAGTLAAQACNAGTFDAASGTYTGAEEAYDVSFTAGAVKVAEGAATEPVVDDSISCTTGASLATSAYISFRFAKSEVEKYNSVELAVTRNTNDNDFNFKEISTVVSGKDPVTGTDYIMETGSYIYYYYYGIELYSLNVPVKAVLNCKDASGKVVAKSVEFTTTLKDALVSNYNKTTNAKVKTAIADMIVAGAEVQKFVTKSAQSSDYAKLALPTEGFDTSLATAELGALNSVDNANNGDVVIAPGAAVGASPYLSFNLAGVDAANASNYNLKVSYQDKILNKDISKTINLADEDVLVSGSKYYAYFYDMAIYATNAEVTADLYIGDSTTPESTYSYSFDTFIEARKTNANMGAALIALGKLGQSFRAMNNI